MTYYFLYLCCEIRTFSIHAYWVCWVPKYCSDVSLTMRTYTAFFKNRKRYVYTWSKFIVTNLSSKYLNLEFCIVHIPIRLNSFKNQSVINCTRYLEIFTIGCASSWCNGLDALTEFCWGNCSFQFVLNCRICFAPVSCYKIIQFIYNIIGNSRFSMSSE